MENRFPDKSPLIAPELEQQLLPLLAQLNQDVQLICLADDGPRSREMGCFLNHLVRLSPRLSCSFFRPEEKPELAARMDGSLLPATGICAGESPRMIFHGIPGGKEIGSFATALLNAGRAVKPLDKYTMKDIGRIRRPMELQVCVSLACHHCAQLVAAAQRIAWENPLVTAHMIDANLYPELVEKYQIERVPLLIVDREQSYPGGKTLAELTTLLARLK